MTLDPEILPSPSQLPFINSGGGGEKLNSLPLPFLLKSLKVTRKQTHVSVLMVYTTLFKILSPPPNPKRSSKRNTMGYSLGYYSPILIRATFPHLLFMEQNRVCVSLLCVGFFNPLYFCQFIKFLPELCKKKVREGIWYFQTANKALSVSLLFLVTVCSY